MTLSILTILPQREGYHSDALVPVDFHVLDNKLNKNHSLLLGRALMAFVGAVYNMQTNQLCLTLINPDVYYDAVRIVKPHKSDILLILPIFSHGGKW